MSGAKFQLHHQDDCWMLGTSQHATALKFFMRAEEDALQRLPLRDPLLKHATDVDVMQMAECGLEDAL
ncbi:uncharacterized protein AKAME5_000002800 [Lates japonicus]|uniref:Uncharacterized protein n=1 Tax=Lates japonicus TaxID=270547 RepID=A0AAD3M0Z4_LATJO|nr:uncharacterized protein AKAME5_000002800 [Lates japonicus]